MRSNPKQRPLGYTLFLTINCDFYLNKLLICCLLIVSKVVVKLRYGVGLEYAE